MDSSTPCYEYLLVLFLSFFCNLQSADMAAAAPFDLEKIIHEKDY
jgi:hypothetical protein